MSVELTEAWLSTETGLSRDVLRTYREKKLSAAGWCKGTRGRVVWTVEGLESAAEAFAELGDLAKKIKRGGGEAEKVEKALKSVAVHVTRKFTNPHLIEALRGGNERIHVRVPCSKNFQPGMRIKALPPKVDGTPWILEGNCPRWLGRF